MKTTSLVASAAPRQIENAIARMTSEGYSRATRDDLKAFGFLVIVDPATLNSEQETKIEPGRTLGTMLVQLGEPATSESEMFGLEVMHFRLTFPARGRHSFVPVEEVLYESGSTIWFVSNKDG
jgi:hypothetical protein